MINITAAQRDAMVASGELAQDALRLDAKRPILQVHKGSGQAYPRTRAAYEATNSLALSMHGKRLAKQLADSYTVYQLVEG